MSERLDSVVHTVEESARIRAKAEELLRQYLAEP